MICKTSVGKHKMLWWCLNFWPWDIKKAWLIWCGWYSRVCYAMLNGKAEIGWNRFVYCGVAGMYIILYCKRHQPLFPQFVLKVKTEIKSLLLAALVRHISHILAPMWCWEVQLGYISPCAYMNTTLSNALTWSFHGTAKLFMLLPNQEDAFGDYASVDTEHALADERVFGVLKLTTLGC